jgi:YesN/AraC family two-component response regulator
VDLIISDLVMPRMGGLELYERSRAVAPGAAFLLTSGYDEQFHRDGLVPQEGVAFLAKPYDIDVLLAKVRELLAPDGAA